MVWCTLFTTFLCTLFLPLLLFLAAVKLWEMYIINGRDHSCKSPLPPGTMGLPFLGETLHMVLQRSKFLQMKRQKYGYIYKTHLFGSPTVRVMGAENVRQILLAEHKLVAVKWPVSVRTILGSDTLSNVHGTQHRNKRKAIMKAFSLEQYIPVVQDEVRRAIERWLRGGSCVLVYLETKRLMFRIAMRVLLGFEAEHFGRDEHELVEAFEEMIKNLFSLPIDVQFSVLYEGLRARNFIHAKIEENIKKKLQEDDDDRNPKDALQLLIDNSRRNEERFTLQEMKESATELLFGGHETTASTATSLVMFLGLHLDALRKGYQIPKGWNVIYSICDTQDVTDVFPNKEVFLPECFMARAAEESLRFNYIPFGGGPRRCVGKQFAKVLLKIFLVELTTKCNWTLLNGSPTMKTGPIVYPVDNLPTKFSSYFDNEAIHTK